MPAGIADSLPGFQLVETCCEARPASLEDEVVHLFERLRPSVFRYLLSLRVTAPDAEEVIQDVFLALFRHLQQGKSRANLQGWIFRVTHNLGLKCRLREYRHAERFIYLPDLPGMTASSAPGPEEVLSSRQRQLRLMAVVRSLPEQDQFCLNLRAEGLRYRQIAEVLGISLGSVAASLEKSLSRLARAEQTMEGGRKVA